MSLTVEQSRVLTEGVAAAQVEGTPGDRRVTAGEADVILSSLITAGASIPDIREALGRDGISRATRTVLTSELAELESRAARGTGHVAHFAGLGDRLPTVGAESLARSIRPGELAASIPERTRGALAALAAGDTHRAVELLAPLVDPANPTLSAGHGWSDYSAGGWGSGPRVDVGSALAAIGASPADARQVRALIDQTRVLGAMESAMGHPPSCPPTAEDLHDYGAALRRQHASSSDVAHAFTAYAQAFAEHAGAHDDALSLTRNIAYPGGNADAAMTPPREATAEGRAIIDCDGYTLLAEPFFEAAGYRAEHVLVTDSAGAEHAMLWATRGGDGIALSNHETFVGGSGESERDRLLEEGVSHTPMAPSHTFQRFDTYAGMMEPR